MNDNQLKRAVFVITVLGGGEHRVTFNTRAERRRIRRYAKLTNESVQKTAFRFAVAEAHRRVDFFENLALSCEHSESEARLDREEHLQHVLEMAA